MNGLECLFSPGDCIGRVADSVISIVPFGTLGMAFIAGMVVGAAIGKWGVAALLALVAAVKFGGNSSHDPVEVPDEDPPHIRRLKQSQGVRPKPPTDSKSAFQKWIRGE
jgi:hypothetical protein